MPPEIPTPTDLAAQVQAAVVQHGLALDAAQQARLVKALCRLVVTEPMPVAPADADFATVLKRVAHA